MLVDPDYRGELRVILHNRDKHDVKLEAGEKIAQLIVGKEAEVKLIEARLTSIYSTDREHGEELMHEKVGSSTWTESRGSVAGGGSAGASHFSTKRRRSRSFGKAPTENQKDSGI